MPDLMNMTPEDINLAVESLPNPSEGHILPGISLQEAIEENECIYTIDNYDRIPISYMILYSILMISYTIWYYYYY
jgi:hypothetical protein